METLLKVRVKGNHWVGGDNVRMKEIKEGNNQINGRREKKEGKKTQVIWSKSKKKILKEEKK